ncbi:Molybdenum transport system protein ModD [Snodgrassella communis]|nr:Molybdenum transport system protein ModD [Snodgrassella communis]
MFYLSDAELDRLLLDDIAYGDLTTRALGIGQQNGQISFCRRQAGRVSGVAIAVRLLQKLALKVVTHVRDGDDVAAGAVLLVAVGNMENLHQGWKVAQNVLEWCGGVAQYMAQMVATAQTINPLVQIACTRKSIPGTKSLAIAAIIDGGGILHRAGTAESILLFANHRRFCAEPDNWEAMVTRLRRAAPEKKVIVEADNVEEALAALNAQADIV